MSSFVPIRFCLDPSKHIVLDVAPNCHGKTHRWRASDLSQQGEADLRWKQRPKLYNNWVFGLLPETT